MLRKISCIVFLIYLADITNSQVNDFCFNNKLNTSDICIHLRKCESAIELLKKRIYPRTCGFDGKHPMVCCEGGDLGERIRKNNVKIQDPNIGNEFIEDLDEIKIISVSEQRKQKIEEREQNELAKHFNDITYVSEQNCYVYQQIARQIGNYTYRRPVIHGDDAKPGEFPHMVSVGYGNNDNIIWGCGGSLISEKFILTAAHCAYTSFGKATFIHLGDIKLEGPLSETYAVYKIYKHPGYRSLQNYHDIALLELKVQVDFSKSIKPACLFTDETYTQKSWEDLTIMATGWGVTENLPQSELLQKVKLDPIDNCEKLFKKNRKLKYGILNETQICFGSRDEERDTCQGDSGGPLQFKDIFIYRIIGITSFGKACGIIGKPGVYTRVSYYVPWIESIVWPQKL